MAQAALIGISALAIGMGALFGGDEGPDCGASQVGGQIGGPFTLVNGAGEEVTQSDVITGPSILYFGYTFCPDVCPTDLMRNVIAVEILEEQGHIVTPIFISVDPERDTPQIADEFAKSMHPRAIGLSGSAEQVREASRAYKTYYAKQEGDPDYYLVDHSTQSYLVTPEGGFLEFFKHGQTPESVAEITACFLAG